MVYQKRLVQFMPKYPDEKQLLTNPDHAGDEYFLGDMRTYEPHGMTTNSKLLLQLLHSVNVKRRIIMNRLYIQRSSANLAILYLLSMELCVVKCGDPSKTTDSERI